MNPDAAFRYRYYFKYGLIWFWDTYWTEKSWKIHREGGGKCE